MRIAILSLSIGEEYTKIVEPGTLSRKEYAAAHGYDFLLSDEYLDPSRPQAWSKILFIQQHLKDYDWIFWSDADSVIMNDAIRLESFLDSDKDLIICSDFFCPINTGQFFLKNTPWSHQILKDIYAQESCIYHPNWEQEALELLLRNDPSLWDHVKVMPNRAFNAFWTEFYTFTLSCPFSNYVEGGYHEKDFLVHLLRGGRCKELLAKSMLTYYQLRLDLMSVVT